MNVSTKILTSALRVAVLVLAGSALACGAQETPETPESPQAAETPTAPGPVDTPQTQEETDAVHDMLRDALIFYASFDGGADAAYAAGSPAVYHAPSWSRRNERAAGLPPDSLVTLTGGGVSGDALEFLAASPGIVLFEAQGNVDYRPTAWSGTISFWLSLDPDEDLEPGYVDPIQISPNAWNDAALFVDFTRDDVPRRFRFAAFADYGVWNPDSLDWSEIRPEDRPMVEVREAPFDRDRWTHVVMTFDGFNTGEGEGIVRCYLDGGLQGELAGKTQTFNWNPEDAVIAIGLDYVGRFDELSIYDRALEEHEVAALHQLAGDAFSDL